MEKNKAQYLPILRELSILESFLFFTNIGGYTGVFARSLEDFYNKMKSIPLTSIEFHSKRGDFARWIKTTLGDTYLSEKIEKVKSSLKNEELKNYLQKIVKERLEYLHKNIKE